MTGSLPPALVYLLGALLLPLIPRAGRAAAFLAIPAAAFALLLGLEPGTTVTIPFMHYELMPLRVDRLSLAFGYVFAAATFIGGVYALHLRDLGQQVAALLYAGSALGAVFAGDLLTLFVFWEVMAVASACLVWARRRPESYRAGMRYFLAHLAGGTALLAGILWHVTETGSLGFERFDPAAGGPAAWLILTGFALNAALPPLHAWLTDAYPRATITGSVFLSAFTTKTAVYALMRGYAGWEVLVWLGVIMALYGVVYAVLENDIRGILSYHIISQVGYMVAGVGIGTEMALNGATAHAVTHILYKGLLFMGAGAVIYATGRSKLTELGGLARALPWVLVLYMVGALSISGFPLFSGFVSKPITVDAAAPYYGWAAVLLHFASVGTFLHTGLKLPYFTWFGGVAPRAIEPKPLPWGMFAAMGLAAALNILLGVWPALLYSVMPYEVDYAPYAAPALVKAAQLLLFTGLGFWLLRAKLGGEATIALDTDWFYRRPARFLYRALVVTLDEAFGAADRATAAAARGLARVVQDPLRPLRRLAGRAAAVDVAAAAGTGPSATLGFAILAFLGCFVVLMGSVLQLW